MFNCFVILFAKPLLFWLSRIIFACSVTHVSRGIVLLVLWHFLEHDLCTWTDQAVETRDHVNFIYFFAFFVRNMCRDMCLDFGFEIRSLPSICIFDGTLKEFPLSTHHSIFNIKGERKFQTMINRSVVTTEETWSVCRNYMPVCTHTRKSKVFAAKSEYIVCLNNIFGWKSFSVVYCVFLVISNAL